VHWTGKDLDKDFNNDLIDLSSLYAKYEDRLINTLSTGLWMMSSHETLRLENRWYDTYYPMTCFTEILLSKAVNHASRYGRLGFGFTRDFVLDAGGSPVLYLRNHPNDSIYKMISTISANISDVEQLILEKALNENYGPSNDPTIIELPEDDELVYTLQKVSESRMLFSQFQSFLKIMSNYEKDDYLFLEEAEWRIVHSNNWYTKPVSEGRTTTKLGRTLQNANLNLTKPLRIQPNIAKVDGIEGTVKPKLGTPQYFIKFSPDDLSLIIFPDAHIRKQVYNNSTFQNWLKGRENPLPLLTVDECISF